MIIGILIIGLLISTLVLYSKNTKLQRDIRRLKKQIQELQNSNNAHIQRNNITIPNAAVKVAYKVDVKPEINNYEEKVENQVTQEKQESQAPVMSQEEKIQYREKTEEEKQNERNTIILVTGATLIILAAILFLTSTWSIIPNIIKTIVLVCLVGVFIGGSTIAKDKGLVKTSETFYYMAMAYIPIALFSVSAFSLFGHYLSLYGEGRFIY